MADRFPFSFVWSEASGKSLNEAMRSLGNLKRSHIYIYSEREREGEPFEGCFRLSLERLEKATPKSSIKTSLRKALDGRLYSANTA